ncbi:hypothetical protein B0H13DRAFT_2300607 [Mycena leptocephala]|nr:hypothetical protein B0H13DRAFT_2300607 [Mycena leptocephala]
MPMDRASTLWGMEAVRVRVRDAPRGRTTVRGERGGRKQVRALGGQLPCIATYRLICLAASTRCHSTTLFEAASGFDLGYEYVGTRSSSIGGRPPELVHNVIANQRLYDYRYAAVTSTCAQRREDAFANHLPSYSQLAEFATVRARRIHRQFTYASHRLPLYCDPSTEEGGDDEGRVGVLIMNGDMLILTADTG